MIKEKNLELNLMKDSIVKELKWSRKENLEMLEFEECWKFGKEKEFGIVGRFNS